MAASEDQLALVTGASSGIGEALAGEFVSHGFDVVMVADEPAIHEAASRLEGRAGRAVAVQSDLSTTQGVERVWDVVTSQGRPLAAAALNAGIGANGRFDAVPLEDDLRVVDLNVRSTVHLAKLAAREMVAAGHGRILVTSSIAAVAPGPYQATYAASKAFVHSFAEGIRVELKGTGVTVTSLMPGPTETEFFARADMQDTKIGRTRLKDDPAKAARDGYAALMAGKASIVAGSFLNKVQAEIGTHLPDVLAAPILARLAKPQR